ncbi:MAG: hypothetical protein P8016_06890 [Sedimentisphaerales bacterium]
MALLLALMKGNKMRSRKFFAPVTTLTLVWVFLAAISGWSWQTNANRSENETIPQREILGVQCHLLAEKEQWQTSEIPKFKAYVSKPGNQNLRLATIVQQNCLLQVDKGWYRYVNPDWTGGMEINNSTEWLVETGAFISITLTPEHWVTLRQSEPLVLETGQHTISFGWSGIKENPDTNSKQEDKTILLVSEPIQIEILKSLEPSKKASEDETHRRRVTELFNSYVHTKPLTTEEQKLGLKTDLILFNDFHPKFTWEDIPFLLELAKNDSLHKGMPSLSISSYIGRYCREGMIALWFIEGLRREQVSLERESQIGEKLHVGSYRLPLNSMCVKKDMKLEECEQSLDIYKTVLQAYVNWWQMVRSLPTSQASSFYPLDLADIEWFGGGNHYQDETLVIYKEQSSSGIIAEKAIRHWIYKDGKNQPDKTFQTIYYTLKNPDENPPFNADMLKVQKIVLYYYDKQDKVIRTKDIIPAVK